MSDHQAFLSAIIARPDDDLPRLVYADYLDESGDAARAEFIRVQCALARLPADDPARPGLAAREAELLERHRSRWVVAGFSGSQEFRRGFVERVRTTAEWLLDSPELLFRSTPVRELRLQTADNYLPELARLPGLARIEALDLTNNSVGIRSRLGQFLSEAPLDALRSLTIRNAQLWADALGQLVHSPVASRLESLDLSGNPFGDDGVAVLAAAPSLKGLRELTLRSDMMNYESSIHAIGASRLANSRWLTQLRSLDLRGHYVGDAGMVALTTSPNAASLVTLDLSYNEIGTTGESGFEALVVSRHLGRLQRLDLSRNNVDRRSAEVLAGWPRRDVQVDLRGCTFDSGAREVLAGSPDPGRFLIDPPEESPFESVLEGRVW